MEITERQRFILDKLVREYIRTGKPVSSRLIEAKYHLDVRSATIRRDLARLDELGFTKQPHISAGRIPTDKAYRLFVDQLFGSGLEIAGSLKKTLDELKKLHQELEGEFKFFSYLTRVLSEISSNLAFLYSLEDFHIIEGWAKLVKEPEFKDIENLRHFAMMVQELKDHAYKFVKDLALKPEIRVFIGKESKIPYGENFSIVMTSGRFKKEPGLIAIAGPKRMDYRLNINLIQLAIEIFN